MELKKNAMYDLVVPSSMGVRITPAVRQPVQTSHEFFMQATSAETNVLSVSSSLGMKTKVLTAFVKDSPIASFIKSDLRSRNIEFDGPDIPQGGPWGYRHQFNIADCGFGMRGPRVWNDRAGEIGRTLNSKYYDLEKLFVEQGVKILHLSGLITSMSEDTSKFCLELARIAKKNNTIVSMDLNYRASFWKGREKELSETFSEIASLSDILVGNEEDFQLCLGMKGPEAGGKDIVGKIDSFKSMIIDVKKVYPRTSIFATTLRQVLNANEHEWGAILLNGGDWYTAEPREIPVLDRIGGGDGFVGGLLYGILKGWNAEDCLHFGWATGALATTMILDYALPADEEQVWSIWEGNARVKR